MTKRELARNIYASVKYHPRSEKDAIDAIEALISMLEPKNPEKFARWGYMPDIIEVNEQDSAVATELSDKLHHLISQINAKEEGVFGEYFPDAEEMWHMLMGMRDLLAKSAALLEESAKT